MKRTKRIPVQMLILNLIAAIVCITGMLVMNYHLDVIVKNYEQNAEVCMRERLIMSDLCRSMSRHHIIVSWHTLTDIPEEKSIYEDKAKRLKAEITDSLEEMNGHSFTDEKEQLFHTVYSNAVSYFSNAENVFQMSRERNSETARYYVTSFLADFIDEITEDIDTMDGYVAAEMAETDREMARRIKTAELSERICILCIVAVTAVCMMLCVGITSRLEKYKNQLEAENERKTQDLVRHNRKMLAIQENAIIGMADLIENRDQDTGEHVKRTSRYVELLTRAAQREGYCSQVLTDDYVELLIKAAPLHDIGKITVSDAILQKPGRLTAEEFDAMKKHTTEGGRIVAEVLKGIEEKGYIDIASQVAAFHHEKWDGTGYPNGLRGETIPLSARIMAVADVFDALVSKRCYKEPMAVDEAFGVIRESGGSHFDPALAAIFCKIRKEVEEVLGLEDGGRDDFAPSTCKSL